MGVVSNCGDGEYYDLTIAFGFWIVGLDFQSFWMGIYLPSLWVFGRVGFWIVMCFQIYCGKELMRCVENQSPRCFGDWLEERGF